MSSFLPGWQRVLLRGLEAFFTLHVRQSLSLANKTHVLSKTHVKNSSARVCSLQ